MNFIIAFLRISLVKHKQLLIYCTYQNNAIYSFVITVLLLQSEINTNTCKTLKYEMYPTFLVEWGYWYQLIGSINGKVTIDTNRWKLRNGNFYWHQQWSHEFVWWYQVVLYALHLAACTLLLLWPCCIIVLIMEEEEEVGGGQFNSFEELESSALISCATSI